LVLPERRATTDGGEVIIAPRRLGVTFTKVVTDGTSWDWRDAELTD
jgi:hypothetical protein